jgi:hypothetical protein
MDGAEKPFCHPKQSSVAILQAYNIILIGMAVQLYVLMYTTVPNGVFLDFHIIYSASVIIY